MKQRTISETSLESTSWRLNLKAADQTKDNIREPVVLLNLNVKDEDPVIIQLDHDGLSKLFQEVEKIQQQIDSLT